jgi:uncharacterized coiled-coil protein SlyX
MGIVSIAIILIIINITLSIKNMATIAELSAKVDDLQVSLDAEQQKIADAIAALNLVIADLQAALAGAATPEAIQAVADKVDAVKADLESTSLG